jgi:hypothetical protein
MPTANCDCDDFTSRLRNVAQGIDTEALSLAEDELADKRRDS